MKEYTHAIAIDLGATNTGVYTAAYPVGAHAQADFDKKAITYQLKDSATLLMKERTTKRHARRGFNRRQMAKRLMVLLAENYFGLDAQKHHQALGFAMNRRGYSYLENQADKASLQSFSKNHYEALPQALKALLDEVAPSNDASEYDMDAVIQDIFSEHERAQKVAKFFEDWDRLEHKIRYEKVVQNHAAALSALANDEDMPPKNTSDLGNMGRTLRERFAEHGVLQSNLQDGNIRKLVEDNPGIKQTIKSQIAACIEASKHQEHKAERQLAHYETIKGDRKELIKISALSKFEWDEAQKESSQHNACNILFSLYKNNDEINKGGKHRRRFFEELREIFVEGNIEATGKHGNTFKPKYLEALIETLGDNANRERFWRCLCHVCNLDTGVLRRYFNDTKHMNGDIWDEQALYEAISRWICNDWRVMRSTYADKQYEAYKKIHKSLLEMPQKKQPGVKQKPALKEKTLKSFLFNTCPEHTIPPYQARNNHKPPHCQSLKLNPDFLDEKYPEWQTWLRDLQQAAKSEKYEAPLHKCWQMTSSKNKPYKKLQELKTQAAQSLHFLLDRSQEQDPLKLNALWGYLKGRKQAKRDGAQPDAKQRKESAQNVLKESKLPENYKKDFAIVEPAEGTFWHLINAYYQARRKAKDGRHFVMTETNNTKDTHKKETQANQILRLCTYKPRQKQHQATLDVINIFGVDEERFYEALNLNKDKQTLDDVEAWLDGFKEENIGVKSLGIKAQALIKTHGNRLALKISEAERLSKSAQKPKESPENKELNNINKCVKQSKAMAHAIAKAIWSGLDEQAVAHKAQRFSSIFSMAQIYALIYESRTGFSNICPVCSTENSARMQPMDASDTKARAQRLPALSVRVIDGAVRKMARIKTDAISKDIWPAIREKLVAGYKVRVPMVVEQNKFSFEEGLLTAKYNETKGTPNAKKYKSAKAKMLKRKETDFLSEKESRVRASVEGVCPYCGQGLSANGEIEHILPKSGRHGALNSEANLTYAHKDCNQKKGTQSYTLNDLHPNYCLKIFGTSDVQEIQKWIIEHFPKHYSNFVRLSDSEQIAMRHALFMPGAECYQQALEWITTLPRTLVNGTQRFFAQMLAQSLYDKARKYDELHKKLVGGSGGDGDHISKAGKCDELHKKLAFDFFQVPSGLNADYSVKARREQLEQALSELHPYKKSSDKNQGQDAYSHVIDAQVAFMLAAEAHQDEGGLRLKLPSVQNKEDLAALYRHIAVPEQSAEIRPLGRKKASMRRYAHRPMFRDTFYAEHYVPLFLSTDIHEAAPSLYVGFVPPGAKNADEQCAALPMKTKQKAADMLANVCGAVAISEGRAENALAHIVDWQGLVEHLSAGGYKCRNGCMCIAWNVRNIQAYSVETYNLAQGYKKWSSPFAFLRSLAYRTERKQVKFIKGKNDESIKTVKEIMSDEERKFTINISKGIKLVAPFKSEWQRLQTIWLREFGAEALSNQTVADQIAVENDFLYDFFILRKYDKKKITTQKVTRMPHQRVRQKFSLPMLTYQGKYLVKHKSWLRQHQDKRAFTYQILNDSDSRSDGVKMDIPAYDPQQEKIVMVRSPAFHSKSMFRLKPKSTIDSAHVERLVIFNPKQWLNIEVSEGEKQEFGISGIEYCVEDSKRVMIKAYISDAKKFTEALHQGHPSWLKPRDDKEKQKAIEATQKMRVIEYKSKQRDKEIDSRIIAAMKKLA